MADDKIQAEAPKEPVPLPELRAGLEFYPSAPTQEGAPTWVIFDPAAYRYYNIGGMEYELLKRWRGCLAQELAAEVSAQTSFKVAPMMVDQLASSLKAFQLIRVVGKEAVEELMTAGEKLEKEKAKQKNPITKIFFIRIPLFKPDAFLTATLPLARPFMTSTFRWITLFCGLLSIYLLSRQWDTFLSTFPNFFSVEGAITLAIVLTIAKTVHELGHAYLTKAYGLEVHTIGVMLLFFWPILYTDTSEAWRLQDRKQRVWIDAAGVITELSLAIYASLLWSFLPDGPFRDGMFMLAAVSWFTTLFMNLNPFMRFDGYYLLADMWGITNLQSRAFILAKWWLRELFFGFGEPPREKFPPQQRRWMIIYAFMTWLYRLLMFAGIGLLVLKNLENFKLFAFYAASMAMFGLLLQPVFKEFGEWWKRRKDMRWNKHTILSLLGLIALITVLVTPWQSRIAAPAIFRAAQEARIYPSYAGQIQEIAVTVGQKVQEGDLLFVLDDPETRFLLERSRHEAEGLRLKLDLQPTDQLFLEQTRVLQQSLIKTLAEIKGLEDRIELRRITAPFTGTVAQMLPDIREGLWISSTQLLALIIDNTRVHVTAFVHEKDVHYLNINNRGWFYADDPDDKPIAVTVSDIDSANIPQLQASDNYISALYEGELAVRPGGKGVFVPQDATYRVRFSLDDPSLWLEKATRGRVMVSIDQYYSIIQRVWLMVSAVAIRESGF